MTDEISQVVKPTSEEEFTAEAVRIMNYLKQVEPTNIRCMAVCIVEKDPSLTDESRIKTSHIVLGSKAQMSAMLTSMYSAIGRSFDGVREASEVKRGNMN